jgi:hypothetical protein
MQKRQIDDDLSKVKEKMHKTSAKPIREPLRDITNVILQEEMNKMIDKPLGDENVCRPIAVVLEELFPRIKKSNGDRAFR